MTASIGIWAQGDPSGERVLYRWEADDQQSGLVSFDVPTRTFRPVDSSGQPIGDLVVDAGAGDSSGDATGINRRLFTQVAASIMRAYGKAGAAPATAHAHFY